MPADGTIVAVVGPGRADLRPAAAFRMETADASLRHLEVKAAGGAVPAPAAGGGGTLVWTPRALKIAQEAGLDPATLAGIVATGPGGRVSGDDVTKFLANRR